MQTHDLPVSVLSKAYKSPCAKEFAWRRDDVPEAAAAIAAAGRAILGGEVWLVPDLRSNWSGLIPSADGSPDGVWSWDTLPRVQTEGWQAYCERTCQESLTAVSSMQVELASALRVQTLLWFNMTFVAEDDA